MSDTQIAKIPEYNMMPVMSLAQLSDMRNQMVQIVRSNVMVEGLHYGKIPGTDKPCLFKAGAEMLTMLFGLSTIPTIVTQIEDWDGSGEGNGEALFFYTYRHAVMRGALLICSVDGSANSRESKHRWRWVNEQDVPPGMPLDRLMKRAGSIREPVFAIEKGDTTGTGRFARSQEYWDNFREAMHNGTGRPVWISRKNGADLEGYEIDSTVYRIPNDSIADVVNTLQKMAQKRSLVGAVLLATGASEFYTQDMEDFADTPVAASVTPSQPTETIEQLHTAFGAIYDSAHPSHLKRIQRMMASVVGKRLQPSEWTSAESRVLRDGALAICEQAIEVEPAPTAPAASPDIRTTQAAEVKQKVNQAKAQASVETPVEAATTVAQLTDEDKLRIEAEEARLQAEEATKAQQSLGVEDELEDPFADS